MAAKDLTAVEVWKDIPEYKGYQASNLGRIRSFREQSVIDGQPKILRSRPTKRGYLKINLMHESGKIRTPRVHQLVLAAFVGPRPPGMVGCHKHGGRANNGIGNLRWSTQKSNLQDAGHKGTKKVLSQEQLDELVRLSRQGVRRSDLAVRFDISRASVTRALAREGVKPLRKNRAVLTQDQLSHATKLRKAGWTHDQIADNLGVLRQTVSRWLSESSADLA